MGVFTRFKDIVNANINAMLDQAEDPEKMINLMIREMEDTIVELKSTCANSMSEEKEIEKEITDGKALVERWDIRARLAVEKQKDDLAREALFEKKAASNQLEVVEENLKQLKTLISESKANIFALEEKLESVKQKKRILSQRATHAQDKKRARENLKKASGIEAASKFDELEQRIRRMEADADLVFTDKKSEKEAEFYKMEKESEIDKELEALKQTMNESSKKETTKEN
ncbi:MAG: hypothetical protein BKP49_03870 [Treponema sp. CETP13]|nr:MAG: hypothetical protein BKP49_03870 [Treponema sp. CETP13]